MRYAASTHIYNTSTSRNWKTTKSKSCLELMQHSTSLSESSCRVLKTLHLPFAVYLGWTITGPIKFDSDKPEKTNFLSDSFEAFDREMTFSTEDDEDPLAESVTSFWKIDTSGTENEDEISLSKNDQRAVEILNNTVRHRGERYEIGLLWREKVTLENNYPVAKAQVQSIDKKLKKDKALKDMYQKTLDTDLEKGSNQ